jgi:glycosyltransferase involved in cell wall biosynthesis
MEPKISIIVPIYKVEPYLKRCIISILDQSFSDFELILVDDGSPDQCGAICDQYAEQDKRVKVIHKRNGGLSSARNAGISIAKGDYIGLVDGDDYLHEKMFEVLYKQAMLHSADMVVCDFLKVNDNENVETVHQTSQPIIKKYTNIEALQQLFVKEEGAYFTNSGNNTKWIVAWNKLYKRELFDNLPYEEGRICEDEFIIHKLLFRCKKILSVSSKLYFYVQRSNSIISSAYSLKRFDKVYALKDRADFFMKIKERKLQNLAYKSYLDSFFWNYYLAKNELSNINKELMHLKQTLNNSVFLVLKNPYITMKQKIAVAGFIISPVFYEFLFNKNA